MKPGTGRLHGALGVAVLAAFGMSLLGASGCDEPPQFGSDIVCPDYVCSDKGVLQGNSAITGEPTVDAFFKSVVDFKTVAAGVAKDIEAELTGIQLDFGISDADLKAAGSLAAALEAKLAGQVTLKVDAQPAKCEVDARLSVEASAQCQASAGCDVDPGMATVQCMGKCSVDIEAGASCEGDLSCEASGPAIECDGTCSGACTVEANADLKCSGVCKGQCSAAGDANGDGVTAEGECTGTCDGQCELSGMAAASCKGSCNGTCKGKPPTAGCSGKLRCEAMLAAMAECRGSCEGTFEPPMVECDARAACEASAKADASFAAKCTPPSVDVKFAFAANASADAKAKLTYAIGQLEVRLPRLLAALKKSEVVVDASSELTGAGQTALMNFVQDLRNGDVSIGVAFKVGTCAPDQLRFSATAIAEAGEGLSTQVSAATGVTAKFGLGG